MEKGVFNCNDDVNTARVMKIYHSRSYSGYSVLWHIFVTTRGDHYKEVELLKRWPDEVRLHCFSSLKLVKLVQ